MIYQELNVSAFRDAFIRYDRNVFSCDGYQALYDWLNDMGDDIELDVIALCGEFSELSFNDVKQYYSLDSELSNDEVVDWLREQTNVVFIGDSSVLFAVF